MSACTSGEEFEPNIETDFQNAERVSPDSAPVLAEPEWSPNEQTLLVSSVESPGGTVGHLYSLEIATSDLLKLSPEAIGTYAGARWLPNEGQLVFWTTVREPSGVWVSAIDELDGAVFVADGFPLESAPDTDEIAYGRISSSENSNQATVEILLLDLATEQETTVFEQTVERTTFGPRVKDMAWSPDGRFLAFSLVLAQDEPGPAATDLYVLSLDQGEAQNLGSYSMDANSLNWSPSSEKLAFINPLTSDASSSTTFQIIDLDGNCHEVEAQSGAISDPALSGDGSRLAFVGAARDIYVANTEELLGEDFWTVGASCP